MIRQEPTRKEFFGSLKEIDALKNEEGQPSEAEQSDYLTVRRDNQGRRFVIKKIRVSLQWYNRVANDFNEQNGVINYLEGLYVQISASKIVKICTVIEQRPTVLDWAREKSMPRKAMMLLRIMQQLHLFHSRGRGHYNLKASNIIVTSEEPLLIDFGSKDYLGKDCDSKEKECMMETCYRGKKNHYQDRSFYEQSTVSIESDVYSMGIIGFQIMAEGEIPKQTYRKKPLWKIPLGQEFFDMQIQLMRRHEVRQKPMKIPKKLIRLFCEMTAKNINTEQVIQHLQSYIAGVKKVDITFRIDLEKKQISAEGDLEQLELEIPAFIVSQYELQFQKHRTPQAECLKAKMKKDKQYSFSVSCRDTPNFSFPFTDKSLIERVGGTFETIQRFFQWLQGNSFLIEASEDLPIVTLKYTKWDEEE